MSETGNGTTKPIVIKGKYAGWASGSYYYSHNLKSLMTPEQADEYWIEFKNWEQELREKNDQGQHDSNFVGIDGVEHRLGAGLEGVLELEDCITEACKRYHQETVSWDDLKAFLVYFPYSSAHPGYAILTKKGNAYPIDTPKMHPREYAKLDVCAMSKLITFEQKNEVLHEQNELIKDLHKEGKPILWGSI